MYNDFAYFYDSLVTDVDYGRICKFVTKQLINAEKDGFQITGSENNLIVDLGCGTGNLMIELLNDNYDVIGIDLSENMLQIAASKVGEEGYSPLLLQQDASELELFGTVACVVSAMDCLNHITDASRFEAVFSKISNYLDDNGLFVFDLLTKSHLTNEVKIGAFHQIEDDITCVWQCKQSGEDDNLYNYDMTFFALNDDGTYDRFDECFEERFYTEDFVRRCITESGLALLDTYDGYDESVPEGLCERMSDRTVFVCRRPARN